MLGTLNRPLWDKSRISAHAWWSGIGLLLALATFFALVLGFWDGFNSNIRSWSRDEYSHAYLIPFICLYLIWQDVKENDPIYPVGSWGGVGLVFLGMFVILMGELSTLYPVIGYGFVFTIWGLAWSWLGWKEFKRLLPVLALLIFTVPLPSFIFNSLSSYLQLVSSQIGVAFIRLFDISVYLEGNVIDLGSMKLQVVEACSGLRYLFPLMTLAFIMALFFRAPWWKRVLLFVSSFPITVLMNSFRIGAIGVLVEYFGTGMAEGFLHDFEGWVVFMAALGVLVVEMWLLHRLGNLNWVDTKRKKRVPGEAGTVDRFEARGVLPSLLTFIVAMPVFVFAHSLDTRMENTPDRALFANFPMQVGDWEGQRELLDGLFLDELDLDDYVLSNFSNGSGDVNLYVAWYDSQRKGESAHSPRTCLPGDGWRIEASDQRSLVIEGGEQVNYNRFLINKNGNRQLVYYWFEQRGRTLTNEYLVKWYLFWDALTQNRTDGALVRFTTLVDKGESLEKAEERSLSFMSQVAPLLPAYFGR